MKDGHMHLSQTKPGARVRIKAISGGHAMSARLASMGIYPGAELRIVRGGRGGPVIAEVRGTRVIVGRGMAARVMVSALP